MKTPAAIKCKCFFFGREHCPTAIFNFFLLLTSMFCLFRCNEPFPSCSISQYGCLKLTWCLFCDIPITFVSFGFLWRPYSCRGSSQMGSFAPTSWDLPTWNTRTPVYIICKQCFWKVALFGNYTYFCLILNNTFHLSSCIEPFPYCSIS